MARSNGSAASVLRNYPNDFLFCRPGGFQRHRWDLNVHDDLSLARGYPESRSIQRIPKECTECNAYLVVIVNKLTGAEITTARRMPKGYYIKGSRDLGVTAQAVRKEAARRLR